MLYLKYGFHLFLDTSCESVLRKSIRARRPRKMSPGSSESSILNKKPRMNRYSKRAKTKNVPFKCDLCGSSHITDPSRRGNRLRLSMHAPSPRHKLDPETGKMLTLCNACGNYFLMF